MKKDSDLACSIANKICKKNSKKCKKYRNFAAVHIDGLAITCSVCTVLPIAVSLFKFLSSIINETLNKNMIFVGLISVCLALVIYYVSILFFNVMSYLDKINMTEEEKNEISLSENDKVIIDKLTNMLKEEYGVNCEFISVKELFNKNLYEFSIYASDGKKCVFVQEDGKRIEVYE